MQSKRQQEPFPLLGTPQLPPVPPPPGAKDGGARLPLHLQEVRDEKGRKRLHGAFTGGFSAGYFNTVGSKEGWQPAQFKSSRQARSSQSSAGPAVPSSTPADFMDEDDMVEFGLKTISATREFDLLGARHRHALHRDAAAQSAISADKHGSLGPVAERIIQDLVVPTQDTTGIKLLRRMGWKPGQGIGPRTRRKLYDEQGEDTHAESHLFAPKDTAIVLAKPKTNVFGLGFDPHAHAPEFVRNSKLETKDGARSRANAGFGIGIFEDDDDIDVYDATHRPFTTALSKSSARLDNDHLDSDDPRLSRHRSSEAHQDHARLIALSGPVIPGFIPAKYPMLPPEKLVAPMPPVGYEPKCPFVHTVSDHKPPTRAGPQSNLTADQRREILGAEAIQAPSKSIFEYIPMKEQDRLQSIVDQTSVTRMDLKRQKHAAMQLSTPDSSRGHDDPSAQVTPTMAQAALKGFIPFGTTPQKQDRYKQFLRAKADLDVTQYAPPLSLSARDAAHELEEFSKAAMIYRPLSSMMASRFTSAVDQTGVMHQVDRQNGHDSSSVNGDREDMRVDGVVDGRATVTGADHATDAQAGTTSAQTGDTINTRRTVHNWQPSKLVCKRFGVPMPHVTVQGQKRDHGGDRGTGSALQRQGPKPILDDASMNALRDGMNVVAWGSISSSGGGGSHVEPHHRDLGVSGDHTLSDDEMDTRDDGKDGDVDLAKRPSMDIFKAIFADLDDDENDDDGDNVTVQNNVVHKAPMTTVAPPKVEEPSVTTTFKPVFRSKDQRSKPVSIRSQDARGKTKPNPGKQDAIGFKPVSVDLEDEDTQPTPHVFSVGSLLKQPGSKSITDTKTDSDSSTDSDTDSDTSDVSRQPKSVLAKTPIVSFDMHDGHGDTKDVRKTSHRDDDDKVHKKKSKSKHKHDKKDKKDNKKRDKKDKKDKKRDKEHKRSRRNDDQKDVDHDKQSTKRLRGDGGAMDASAHSSLHRHRHRPSASDFMT